MSHRLVGVVSVRRTHDGDLRQLIRRNFTVERNRQLVAEVGNRNFQAAVNGIGSCVLPVGGPHTHSDSRAVGWLNLFIVFCRINCGVDQTAVRRSTAMAEAMIKLGTVIKKPTANNIISGQIIVKIYFEPWKANVFVTMSQHVADFKLCHQRTRPLYTAMLLSQASFQTPDEFIPKRTTLLIKTSMYFVLSFQTTVYECGYIFHILQICFRHWIIM